MDQSRDGELGRGWGQSAPERVMIGDDTGGTVRDWDNFRPCAALYDLS